MLSPKADAPFASLPHVAPSRQPALLKKDVRSAPVTRVQTPGPRPRSHATPCIARNQAGNRGASCRDLLECRAPPAPLLFAAVRRHPAVFAPGKLIQAGRRQSGVDQVLS